jgi:hypothetical protein
MSLVRSILSIEARGMGRVYAVGKQTAIMFLDCMVLLPGMNATRRLMYWLSLCVGQVMPGYIDLASKLG